MTSLDRWETDVPALLLAVAAVLGCAAGVLIAPEADVPVLVSTAAQLGATALGRRMAARPVVATALVAAVTLGTALEPDLRVLLHLGAVPWVTLALALATANLVRRAKSPIALVAGGTLLTSAVSAVASVAILAGGPITTNVLASSVPVLGGALVAAVQRLNEARRDRLARPAIPSAGPGPASDECARQALLLVAMRAETLLHAAPDETAAAQARDLRTVALQGLQVPGAEGQPRISVQVAVEPGPSEPHDRAAPAAAVAAPPLNEREREITRLLATGASNAQIARELYLSEATIKGHVSRLMRRLDCGNRTQLALLAATWAD